MLFLLRVGDAKATSEALMDMVTLAETVPIMDSFNATGGLIRKLFPIDDACRLKNRLETVGTVVEFVRPDVENDAD